MVTIQEPEARSENQWNDPTPEILKTNKFGPLAEEENLERRPPLIDDNWTDEDQMAKTPDDDDDKMEEEVEVSNIKENGQK